MKKARFLPALAPILALFAFAGCTTTPVWFEPSSAPVPPEGYTIHGLEVSGASSQIWVFGLGGNASDSGQRRAYRDAMAQAPGADALVSMCIDQSSVCVFPFFMQVTTRVTGTPVKFNTPAK